MACWSVANFGYRRASESLKHRLFLHILSQNHWPRRAQVITDARERGGWMERTDE